MKRKTMKRPAAMRHFERGVSDAKNADAGRLYCPFTRNSIEARLWHLGVAGNRKAFNRAYTAR